MGQVSAMGEVYCEHSVLHGVSISLICLFFFFFFFFFSSRRRHTRYIGDWSSDVCSSDLGLNSASVASIADPADPTHLPLLFRRSYVISGIGGWTQIGRASCRERV